VYSQDIYTKSVQRKFKKQIEMLVRAFRFRMGSNDDPR